MRALPISIAYFDSLLKERRNVLFIYSIQQVPNILQLHVIPGIHISPDFLYFTDQYSNLRKDMR